VPMARVMALTVRRSAGECQRCPGGMTCHGGLELVQRLHTYPVQYHQEIGATTEGALASEVWSMCKEDEALITGDVVNQQCLRVFCRGEDRANDPRCKPTFPELQLGYWSDPMTPLDVYKCQALIDATVEGAFFSCPGGRPGTCADGRTGLACGECGDTMYMHVDGTCIKCEGGIESLVVGAIMLLLVAVPGMYYFINGKISAQTSTMMATGVAMGSLLTLTQHFSVLGQMMINWEEPMKSIWGFLGIFMFDPKFLASGCVFGDAATFVGRIALPGFLVVWMIVVALGTKVAGKTGALGQGWVMVWPKVRNTLGQVFQAFYIAIAMSCILAFQCYSSPNGTKSLAQHPYVLCGSRDHTPFMVFGIIGIAFYLVGFGVFYIWACTFLPRQSQKGMGPASISAYRFIFYRFRPEYYYWGSVFLCRNLLLTLASVLDPANPYTGVMYLGLVAVCFLIAQCVCWPWRTNMLNALDTIILATMVAVVFSTIPFIEVRDKVAVDNTKENLVTFMVLVFCFASMTVVGTIVGNIVMKARELRDPIANQKALAKQDRDLLAAWSELMRCSSIERFMQDEFVRNLGPFDRAMVHKMAGIVNQELSRSASPSKRSSRRVAMQKLQVAPVEATATGTGAETSCVETPDMRSKTPTPPGEAWVVAPETVDL